MHNIVLLGAGSAQQTGRLSALEPQVYTFGAVDTEPARQDCGAWPHPRESSGSRIRPSAKNGVSVFAILAVEFEAGRLLVLGGRAESEVAADVAVVVLGPGDALEVVGRAGMDSLLLATELPATELLGSELLPATELLPAGLVKDDGDGAPEVELLVQPDKPSRTTPAPTAHLRAQTGSKSVLDPP